MTDGNGNTSVTVDPTASLPGRGAWLHPDQQCAQMAVRRRAFVRALRLTGSPDTSAVIEYVERIAEDLDSSMPRQQNR
ncbi:YlxR family protein [Mycolicibacterium setense]|uniref:YlxR family protein n=1 Tax=Mycolicibacterium setense TaxID=431269 RepID=UPI001F4183F6|nr:YlxR family protein [Mycolicibacterium setense]